MLSKYVHKRGRCRKEKKNCSRLEMSKKKKKKGRWGGQEDLLILPETKALNPSKKNVVLFKMLLKL